MQFSEKYNIYFDFIEQVYMWGSKGCINYLCDGNFIKVIMRINNICEILLTVAKNINNFSLCEKLENYNKILIRDFISNDSLYIK